VVVVSPLTHFTWTCRHSPLPRIKPLQVIDFISKQNPNNHLGTPEDIAPVITFVASPAAQWLNGQNILTNGVTVFLTFEVFELPTDLYFI